MKRSQIRVINRVSSREVSIEKRKGQDNSKEQAQRAFKPIQEKQFSFNTPAELSGGDSQDEARVSSPKMREQISQIEEILENEEEELKDNERRKKQKSPDKRP